jgi:hypothetical protein
MEKNRNVYTGLVGKHEGEENLEDLSAAETIISKWVQKRRWVVINI